MSCQEISKKQNDLWRNTMNNISIKQGSKSYGSRPILENVNFSISEGQKLAIVGSNGEGKSTLLKIISGLDFLDSGDIFGDENYCAYIAQDFSGEANETPEQFFTRNGIKISKVEKILKSSGLNLDSQSGSLSEVLCGNLSGGERKKLEIAAGLAINSSFLAIDEPENHLDMDTIEWLVETLKNYKGGLIFVSHDQYFIDQLANTVVELESGKLKSYSMNYEDYLNEKEKQLAGKNRTYLAGQHVINRLKQTVEMMRERAKKTSSTAGTYHHNRKRLEKMQEEQKNNRVKAIEKPKISIAAPDRKRQRSLISIKDGSFSYGDHKVFDEVNVELNFGEKVALLGPNGSGKSTLLRLVNNELTPESGTFEIRPGIKSLILTQDHLEGISPNESVLDLFRREATIPETDWRTLLVNYGITRDLVNFPVRLLSGGQQARMKLALIISQRPELIIMDEPTNHVDPLTWDAIVEAVQNFPGTVLTISHDRAFVDAVATSLWIIKDKKIHTQFAI